MFIVSLYQHTRLTFEIIFNHDNTTHQYGFSVRDELEESAYVIGSEWLLVNDKLIFEREEKKLSFGKGHEKELEKLIKSGKIDYILAL